MVGVTDRLKNLDRGTISKEFRVYTVQGAVLSVITIAFIVYLVVKEAYFNFQIVLHERVHVNATSPRGLEIEFDISFADLSCSHVKIDAADPTGQPQSLHLDSLHHVWKHRYKMVERGGEKHRQLIGSKEKLELGSTMLKEEDLEEKLYDHIVDDEIVAENKNKTKDGKAIAADDDVTECGSCYGAGEDGECCNTCEDVKRAYRRKGWVLQNVDEIKQCIRETQEVKREGSDEGCNIHGIVALSSGGGNLHFAPGQDFANGVSGTDIFQLLMQQFNMWNVSHTIHKLRFGPDYPGAVYQLDNKERIVKEISAMYQYYFQIVPTLYRYRNGTTVQTFQYSVTEHLRHLQVGSSRGLPGVFFFYEVSPLHVEITEGYQKGWIAFFTSVCAVIGGVVTVMGMLDQYLFTHKGKRKGDSLAY